MKGVKTIRTSNWDKMTSFYSEILQLKERDHEEKERYREYSDFGTEIHLERVRSTNEHEVLGSLELYSINIEGLVNFWNEKKIEKEVRKVSGRTEILVRDPDDNLLIFVQKE
ncbi:MAG: hypothetical protein JJT75_15180 [Opitutales bacterium]|nr:hypothetical protein [Opitutales bacterium]